MDQFLAQKAKGSVCNSIFSSQKSDEMSHYKNRMIMSNETDCKWWIFCCCNFIGEQISIFLTMVTLHYENVMIGF